MPESINDNPLLRPDHELPAPHDMLLDEGNGTASSTVPSETHRLPFPMWILPLIGFLLVLLAGGMYFLNMQKETEKNIPATTPTPMATPQPTEVPITKATEFTDAGNRFTLTFPSAFIINKSTGRETYNGITPTESTNMSSGPLEFSMQVTVFDTLGGVTAEKFIPNYYSADGHNDDINGTPYPVSQITYTKKIYNGQSVTLINGLQTVPGGEGTIVWIQKGSYAILITSQSTIGYEAMLDTILKTIRFSTITPTTAVAAPSESISSPMVACTMDAKTCPDGSFVGRTGPKCEFAACPK